jgi:hypothetical protein
MRRGLLVAIAIVIVSFLSIPARADEIVTFQLSDVSFISTAFPGAIISSALPAATTTAVPVSASGTVTIDTATGDFVSADVLFTNDFFSSSNILFNGPAGATLSSSISTSTTFLDSTGVYSFYLDLPGSLIGYDGGPICSYQGIYSSHLSCTALSTIQQSGVSFEYYFWTGELDPVSTPEPAPLILLGTGLLLVLRTAKHRSMA